jgi:hypothetical protein
MLGLVAKASVDILLGVGPVKRAGVARRFLIESGLRQPNDDLSDRVALGIDAFNARLAVGVVSHRYFPRRFVAASAASSPRVSSSTIAAVVVNSVPCSLPARLESTGLVGLVVCDAL